ncbi:MAG: sulfatase, partial [Acidobacteria bacterium]|nr:sulfatase [Acidobacteriota bacterium]
MARPSTVPSASRRRWSNVGPALALALLIAGCGPGEVPSVGPGDLGFGRLVFAGPLVAVPDHNWTTTEDGGWTFRGSATVRFRNVDDVAEPVEVFFTPQHLAADFRFRLTWDGALLLAPTAGKGSEIHATLPAAGLAPGDHVLEIERIYDGPRINHDNDMKSFGYRVGGRETSFAAERQESYRYLGDFLTVGVTGVGRQKYGGVLFSGPGATDIEPDPGGHAHLGLDLENFSTEPATFAVTLGGQRHERTVPPMEERAFRLPMDAGRQTARLEVEGAADGLFLWGAPTIEVAPETEVAAEAPPIVLITLDTTRRDALSPYGEDPRLTPVLDRFAQEATVFERAYSAAPWTLPSHASIMTGLYPSHHGAGVSAQFLASGFPTLASVLRAHGYFTAGFSGGRLCSHRYGIGQGFDSFRNPENFETAGDEMTRDLEGFLESHQRQPFFLFANYFDPHAMYRAPKEYTERVGLDGYRKALEGHPIWQWFDRGDSAAWRRIIDLEAPATPGILAYMRAAYLSEVSFMDAQLGQVFDSLRQLGLYDRAMIVLVADHGELLGEHGRFSHAGRLDPELTEIPLLIKWPGQTEGRRVRSLASHVDLMSTVLAAVGIAPPANDGHPLAWEESAEGGPAEVASPAAPSADQPSPAPGSVGGDRRVLFMEEHESRVHPLPDSLRIAPHVYGVQRP